MSDNNYFGNGGLFPVIRISEESFFGGMAKEEYFYKKGLAERGDLKSDLVVVENKYEEALKRGRHYSFLRVSEDRWDPTLNLVKKDL